MKKKYSIKKFNGDDQYSWAVFHAADVKGVQSVIRTSNLLSTV